MDTSCFPMRHLVLALVLTIAVFPLTSLAGTSFKPPVQVTPYPGKGYEPGIVVDRFRKHFRDRPQGKLAVACSPRHEFPHVHAKHVLGLGICGWRADLSGHSGVYGGVH